MIKNNIKFNSKFSLLFFLIFSSFLARFVTAYFVGDRVIDNEWSVLVNNLINYKAFAFYASNDLIIPSAYMPPIYPFFLYLIKIITFDKIDFLSLIISFQVILSTYSIYIFYELNQKIFSNKLSLINSFIFSYFPLNLYAAGQISSITLQILLSLLFLKYFFCISEKKSSKNIIIFSIISGILILTRGEFILIFLVTILYLIFFKKISLAILIKTILITFLIISPYMARNYIQFNEIFVVKSLGFNLWKGNNPTSLVQGTSDVRPPNTFEQLKQWKTSENSDHKILKAKLEKIKIDRFYEINRDKVFLDEAKNNLHKDPGKYINLFLKKIFSYYFIDLQSSYHNYYNFFHFFPVVIFGIFSLPGVVLVLKKKDLKLNYLLVFLLLNLAIFSFFFILPRYKLIILPIQIILATYFIRHMLLKFNITKKL